MKKLGVLLPVLFILGGIICLLISMLFFYAAFHTHDGPSGLFRSQLRLTLVFFIAGIVLIAGGIFVIKKRRHF